MDGAMVAEASHKVWWGPGCTEECEERDVIVKVNIGIFEGISLNSVGWMWGLGPECKRMEEDGHNGNEMLDNDVKCEIT